MAARPYRPLRFYAPRFARSFGGTTNVAGTTQAGSEFEYNTPFSVFGWFNFRATTAGILASTLNASTNYRGWELSINSPGGGTGLNVWLINTYSSNLLQMVSGGAVPPTGTWVPVGFTYDGSATPAGVTLFSGGSTVSTTAYYNTLSATIISGNPIMIGHRWPTDASAFPGSCAMLATFNRRLPAKTMVALSNGAPPWEVARSSIKSLWVPRSAGGRDKDLIARNTFVTTGATVTPFQQRIRTRAPILYSFASGGGGTLVGTAAATSTATGTLTGAGLLTGTAAATSTATGILAGAGTLAGTSAAASTATGTLAGAGLLTGAAAAASTATGTLSGGAYLTGTAAATSTATGALAGAGALAGTATATSTATGTLSSGAYLIGTAAATSTATGTLAGAGALAGTAAATSTATATLAGSGALTGTSAATSTTTGTLTTATSLVGRADATSTATGILAGAGRMTGTAAATSTAPAFLIGFGPISGIAAATSTATGTLASRSWVFRAGRIVSIPADIRTAAIPADVRTVL